MKNIRITLIRSLPKIKLFIDRFVKSMRITIHHIDLATDQVKAFMKMEAKITSFNIEKAYVNAMIRFRSSIKHTDYDNSSIRGFQKNLARIHSIDYSISELKALLNIYEKIKHVDVDNSSVKAMLVYPVLLGEHAEMTLGEIASKTLGELTFREIDM